MGLAVNNKIIIIGKEKNEIVMVSRFIILAIAGLLSCTLAYRG